MRLKRACSEDAPQPLTIRYVIVSESHQLSELREKIFFVYACAGSDAPRGGVADKTSVLAVAERGRRRLIDQLHSRVMIG